MAWYWYPVGFVLGGAAFAVMSLCIDLALDKLWAWRSRVADKQADRD